MSKYIYLDNAATTRVLEESAKIAYDAMVGDFGNPSSVHIKGYEAERLMTDARENIAKDLCCDPKEIIFTSGGTEANNQAIFGAVYGNPRKGKHIVASSIEHSSVYNPIHYLEEKGYDVTYILSDEMGRIRLDMLSDAIQRDTVLVSIMLVNNEVGTLQPMEEISNIVKRASDSTILHVDAIQAAGKLPINLKRTKVDLLSVSGHKFHSPKGCGILYKRANTKISNLVYGGGQESNFRSGTENVPGILAMANSFKVANMNMNDNLKKVSAIRGAFIEGIKDISDIKINGFEDSDVTGKASPYIVNVSFKGVRAEVLIHSLEEKGIYVSSTSACSSHTKTKSRTLQAMGLTGEEMESAIRFSFSKDTTSNEIKETIKAIEELLPKLRKFTRR